MNAIRKKKKFKTKSTSILQKARTLAGLVDLPLLSKKENMCWLMSTLRHYGVLSSDILLLTALMSILICYRVTPMCIYSFYFFPFLLFSSFRNREDFFSFFVLFHINCSFSISSEASNNLISIYKIDELFITKNI